ncbi:Fc.00g031150.m01.CDS01 [Cosmosporella sp. VM-42]
MATVTEYESEKWIVTEFATENAISTAVMRGADPDPLSIETAVRGRHWEDHRHQVLAAEPIECVLGLLVDGVVIGTSPTGALLRLESLGSPQQSPRSQRQEDRLLARVRLERAHHFNLAKILLITVARLDKSLIETRLDLHNLSRMAANRNFTAPVASPAQPTTRHPQTPGAPVHRSGTTSPTIPPSGPRGYVPPTRGGYSSRGGRGGWNQGPPRHMGPSPTPSTPNGPSTIPTGPRATPSNGPSSSTPTQARPFNPPTGPSAQHAGGQRPTLAQSMLATLPPIIPGGKLDPSMTPLLLGVTKELEPHYRKLRDEEEKLRDELHLKQERLRKSLATWDRLDRDSKHWALRSDLSEKCVKNLAGEGTGGAAF